MRKWLKKSDKGEIMIESMLVLIPTLFVVVFLISLGFLLYQQWNIQYLADDIASKVSDAYSYKDADIATAEVTLTDITDRELYRYLFKVDEYDTCASERGKEYAKKMLKKTTFANPTVAETVTITPVENDSVARQHIEVTVSGTYKIPFSEGLEVFGMSGTRTFTATSVAECVDLTDYIGTVNYVSNCESMLGIGDFGAIEAVNSWLKVIKHVLDGDD